MVVGEEQDTGGPCATVLKNEHNTTTFRIESLGASHKTLPSGVVEQSRLMSVKYTINRTDLEGQTEMLSEYTECFKQKITSFNPIFVWSRMSQTVDRYHAVVFRASLGAACRTSQRAVTEFTIINYLSFYRLFIDIIRHFVQVSQIRASFFVLF